MWIIQFSSDPVPDHPQVVDIMKELSVGSEYKEKGRYLLFTF